MIFKDQQDVEAVRAALQDAVDREWITLNETSIDALLGLIMVESWKRKGKL